MIDKKLQENLDDIYQRRGESMVGWSNLNVPDLDLLWREKLPYQIKSLVGVALALGLDNEPKVVCHHTSKSVHLPVTCFKFSPYDQVFAYCFTRDNFYDIKLCVVCDGPVRIPYGLIHAEWSPQKYELEKERCRSYRLETARDGKEREEILELLSRGGDEWYSNGWSNGTIIRHGERIYRAERPLSVYCEGICRLGLPDEVFRVFEQGMTMFGCSIGTYGRLALVLEHISKSLENERYRRLEAPRCRKEPIPEDSDHMTLEDFISRCKSLCFIDYDGFGNYATADEMATDKGVVPSDIMSGNIDYNFSHVVWFNK